jgi:hypothetical protein
MKLGDRDTPHDNLAFGSVIMGHPKGSQAGGGDLQVLVAD